MSAFLKEGALVLPSFDPSLLLAHTGTSRAKRVIAVFDNSGMLPTPRYFWGFTGSIDLKCSMSSLPARVGRTEILFDGEFDPGSERTLAAWIRHASRAIHRKVDSGKRVRNA